MVKVRFAPSPTGYVHIGNMRIAFLNWLYALKNKGTFVLRYDDTDVARSKQEFIDAIAEDLSWLGITPHEVEYQSKRFPRYNEIVEQLKEQGLLYACYETAEELERKRKIQLSRKLPPMYQREALRLTKEQKAEFEAQGRKPHWRFLLPNFSKDPFNFERTEISWEDEVRGRCTVDLASLSDPILIREDGTYLYTLPSVIDDIDMKISHIIRGEDHITNTAVQLAIFDSLKAQRPAFGHINLLMTASGDGLSKRKGDLSIRTLKDEGFEPMAIASLAVLLGSSQNVCVYNNIEELVDAFDLKSTSRSSAKFDVSELLRLNSDLMHMLPYEKVQQRLQGLGMTGEHLSCFWYAIRGNITKLSEALYWWRIVTDDQQIYPVEDAADRLYLKEACSLLPEEPFNEDSWKVWTERIKEKTERKGKMLFKPLRQALTGHEGGPEFSLLMPIMGKELIKKRLQQEI